MRPCLWLLLQPDLAGTGSAQNTRAPCRLATSRYASRVRYLLGPTPGPSPAPTPGDDIEDFLLLQHARFLGTWRTFL